MHAPVHRGISPLSPFPVHTSFAPSFFLSLFLCLASFRHATSPSLLSRCLSLARSRARSATVVASDSVSNGSGGHTILRLNSTDTAAQLRSFSSYSLSLAPLLCPYLPFFIPISVPLCLARAPSSFLLCHFLSPRSLSKWTSLFPPIFPLSGASRSFH